MIGDQKRRKSVTVKEEGDWDSWRISTPTLVMLVIRWIRGFNDAISTDSLYHTHRFS